MENTPIHPDDAPVPADVYVAPVPVEPIFTSTSEAETVKVPTPEPTPAPVAEAAAPKVKEKPQKVGQTMQAFGSGLLAAGEVNQELVSAGPGENPRVKLQVDYTTEPMLLQDRKDLDGTRELLPFLAERSIGADERIRTYVSPRALLSGRGRDWNEAIVTGASYTAFIDNRFDSTLRREDADFKQWLDTESGKIGYTAPVIKEAGVGAAFTGEKAIHRVRSILGQAGQCSVPLFHSGFWVTLQAPSDSDLIELHRRIQEEKINLGRETYGLVFSNEQSYINSFLLDFCLENIHSHTVRVDSVNQLRPLIKIEDLNILFWGMACLIWPRGFDYIRSVMTKDGIESNQIISAKISLGKLLWVDNASFDDKHRAHLSNKQRNQMTVESIQEYQKTFIPSLSNGRLIEIKEGLSIIVASTNVDNYIADGAAWIAGIVQTVDSTFTQAAPDENTRNRMIETHARATRLRNNGAWIKAVVIDGYENNVREDIVEVLNLLSEDEEFTERVNKGVTSFMDDCVRALIAIPATDGVPAKLPLFPNLIPVDVVNAFFTLLGQRVGIIANR